ncbi:nucleoside permease [Cellvibrio japonicus]|uniref:Nucleoside-transport system protein n=1 Tax=Cellvibrio japonicus (strain Ueda107) TaxID=498211 RepID=B3PF28_CELJU|nr:nucleoside permease [Cellvibrio japonicus]ACE85317.1 nucleoside-transport system protein [Cellvibrio japonicus Ueda107]QEI13587.1 nucleoside permease [Cellvibrio japonicus]QEI17161.1 nucleoside permease [Cellvibrio japonicus]QEI20738.1 nucleoside permease [Cellvibrio japonicus]
MNLAIRLKLSTMMFLEFFIWGAWFVTMGTFLAQAFSATGVQTGMAYNTQAIGAIVAPFIIGLIADRFFAAQKILAVLHILGGVLLWFAASSADFDSFYPYILLYMLLYMPTLALVNSVAFRHLPDPTSQFAQIRVLGTVGWIVAGVVIGNFGWESKNALHYTFQMAAVASFGLGVLSFFLPHTPPAANQGPASLRSILGLDALALLKDTRYLVFFIASILICIPLAFYYQNANLFLNAVGVESAATKMSYGQVSEVLFMLLLPMFIVRFGIKISLLVGMAAWVLRYVLFAYGDAGDQLWMLILGIVLHGICYDFFFVTGQIYTNYKASAQIKSAAQGLITLATYGVGMLIGFTLAGVISDKYTVEGAHAWFNIWIIPAAIALAVMVLFLLSFKDEKVRADQIQH